MGSPAGRLFQSLRDHHGIAYELDASHAAALGGGCFALELTTESRRSEEARERLLHELCLQKWKLGSTYSMPIHYYDNVEEQDSNFYSVLIIQDC